MKQILLDRPALVTIGYMMAILTLPVAIYMIGPWYAVISPPTSSFMALSTLAPTVTKVLAALLLVDAAMILYGLWRDNPVVLKYGYILAMALWSLIFVMRLIALGPLPMVWLQQVFFAAVAGVLALNVRSR